MKKNYLNILSILIVSIVLVSACNKKEGCTDADATNYDSEAKVDDGSCEYDTDSTDVGNTSTGAASASMSSNQEDMMIYNFTTNSAENGDISNKTQGDTVRALPSCATVSLQSNGVNTWPKTLTIDFGTTGCVGYDGKSRKGKIIAEFSGNWRQHNVGDSITVTFDNYSVNDTIVGGTRYFWINTSNVTVLGTMTLGYKVVDGSLQYSDGTQSTWQGEGTMDISGLNTLFDYTDDIIDTDFTGSGTTVDSSAYTFDTPTPLRTDLSCIETCAYTKGVAVITTTKQTVVTGEVNGFSYSYTYDNDIDITLDFGDGTCDGTFDLTTAIESKNESGVTVYQETIGPTTYACGELSTIGE